MTHSDTMATAAQTELVYNLVNIGTLTLASDLDPEGIVVSGDMLIVTDDKARKVDLYGLHDTKLLATQELEAEPVGICVINDTDMCVALANGTIEIMSIQHKEGKGFIKSGKKLNVSTLFDACHGVARFKDKIVISGVKQNMICWSTMSLDDGNVGTVHMICEGKLWSHLTTKDNMMYISCNASRDSPDTGVYGYDIENPSEQTFIYKHEALNFPFGITVDDNKFVFVCNCLFPYDSIHHLTDKCELVTIYRDDIPRLPYAILWDHGTMYVTNMFRNNEITLYKPQYSLQQELQDGEEFLEAMRCNDQKVDEMIRNLKIPKHSTMKVAMKQGIYSMGVQRALNEMSKLLRREISDAVCVFCGYGPEDPYTPVFVVTLKNQKCILKKEEIPEPFSEYKIITRYKHVPNDEEKHIVEQYGSKSVRSEDVTRVNNCIATYTESLMMKHSNLSIIRPSPFKAYGYLRNKMKVKLDTCIVFYVPVKGIIPVGEAKFPNVIDGLPTDVREGEFVTLGGHNAMEYHAKLKIGCFITNGCNIGTLGGFVDLPSEKVGCLTAAHVVLTEKQIKQYINMGGEEKQNLNDSLAQGKEQIEIYQPGPESGYKPFGKLQIIALEEGNSYTPSVDAAIIQITDDDRKPEMGSFPDGDFKEFGLTKEDPLLFTGGEILDDSEIHQKESMVIKFGCTSGLTHGLLSCNETSVRRVDMRGIYCFPVMYKQLEVSNEQHAFAAAGDSGALVFLCVGTNIRNLRAVGMVIGEHSTGCSCVITPIKPVFENLGLTSNKFKVFPASHLSQLREHINAQGQMQSKQKEDLKILSDKITSIEQKINFLEQTMNEQVQVHSGLSENFNSRLDILEKNVTESSDKMNSKIDTLDKRLDKISSNINESFTNVMEVLKQMNNKI